MSNPLSEYVFTENVKQADGQMRAKQAPNIRVLATKQTVPLWVKGSHPGGRDTLEYTAGDRHSARPFHPSPFMDHTLFGNHGKR